MTRLSPEVRDNRRALHRLARLQGVQTGFTGNDGRRHAAGDDALVAVLAAMGAPLASAADAADALQAATAARDAQVIEPVVVHRPGAPASADVSIDRIVDPDDVWVTLEREDGEVERRRLGAPTGRPPARAANGARARHKVRFGASSVPQGYHRLRVEGPGWDAESLLISAPSHLPAPNRSWGLTMPLYALRSRRDWGVGSFADLADMADWVGELGGDLVGTLPLFASFLDSPGADPSPYRPASRLMWNELYLDVESAPELAGAPKARALLGTPALRDQLHRLRRSTLAYPGATLALKRRLLQELAGVLSSGRQAALETFATARPEVLAYARYRAERERNGESARPPTRQATFAEVAADDTAHYHLYVQFLAEEQLAGLGAATHGMRAGLYLDLPVGVHPEGFDPWWEPDAFVHGVSGGAPPDQFFAGGQSWGFPPLHPEGIRRQGYRHVIAVLRQAMRHASMLRLDHVMGLHRLYWVPPGFEARHGVYVQYHAEELHAVTVLEAHRSQTVVAGEDLGTVPSALQRAMARDRMLHSHVFQFESTPEEPLPPAPRLAVASLGSHDLPPFAAYWRGLDIGDRRRRDLIDAPTAAFERRRRRLWRAAVLAELPRTGPAALPADGHAAEERRALAGCLNHLAEGGADVVLVDLEDLWLEAEPQNRPGTGPEQANFRRRAAASIEDAAADPEIAALLREINSRRRPELVAGALTDDPDSEFGGPR